MNRYTRIRIDGFRRLAKIDLEMRPLMVLIGANGSGKTSMLEAFTLLAASANGNLVDTLSSMGGISSILTRDGREALAIGGDLISGIPDEAASHEGIPSQHFMNETIAKFRYDLEISPDSSGFKIKQENLFDPRITAGDEDELGNYISSHEGIISYSRSESPLPEPVERPHLAMRRDRRNFHESALSQSPAGWLEYELPKSMLKSIKSIHRLDVSARGPIKSPQQMKPVDSPGENGENLISFLFLLQESDSERFKAIEEIIKTAFETFDGFGFRPVAAGVFVMTWKEKGGNSFFLNELSEGTLRFLWLVAVLNSNSKPCLLTIDEPEVSLHPEMLMIFAEILRDASTRSQIVVATHSDRLISFLKPTEVVVLDVELDGLARATWADTLDLNRWLEEYTLDELWRMGQIGGRG